MVTINNIKAMTMAIAWDILCFAIMEKSSYLNKKKKKAVIEGFRWLYVMAQIKNRKEKSLNLPCVVCWTAVSSVCDRSD